MTNKKRESRAGAEVDGQSQLKIPKQLQAALAKRAEAEGVSLETLVAQYLASAVGQPAATNRPKRKSMASIHRSVAAAQTPVVGLDRPIKRQTSEMRVLNPTSIGVVVVRPPVKKGKKGDK
jgi:hypothetical protein